MGKTFEQDLINQPPKNFIINGEMRVAARGTSFPAIIDAAYSLDRWQYTKTAAGVHTVSQDTDVPTFAQSNYPFQASLRLNLTTPDTTIAAGDYNLFGQKVEGYNYAIIVGKPFVLSFWVKATLPGTYCVSFQNSAGDRSFVTEYTINAANTWEYKTVRVAASPAAGGWNYNTGVGLRVWFVLAAGTTFQTTKDSWQTGNFFATTSQVNGINTGATDFRVTGVMLNEGYDPLPFRLFGGDWEKEIAACQRYYELVQAFANCDATNPNIRGFWASYKVQKRASGLASTISQMVQINGGGGDFTITGATAGTEGLSGATNVVGGVQGRQYQGLVQIDAEL